MTSPGHQIRKLRESHNISLRELAAETPYDVSYLSLVERGKRGCSERLEGELLIAIEEALHRRKQQRLDVALERLQQSVTHVLSVAGCASATERKSRVACDLRGPAVVLR